MDYFVWIERLTVQFSSFSCVSGLSGLPNIGVWVSEFPLLTASVEFEVGNSDVVTLRHCSNERVFKYCRGKSASQQRILRIKAAEEGTCPKYFFNLHLSSVTSRLRIRTEDAKDQAEP